MSDIYVEPGKIKCSSCMSVKPATTEHFYANKTSRLGVSTRCRDCQASTAVRHRLKNRLKAYGIGVSEYNAMYSSQDGKCFLCGRHGVVLCVDHCHSTGRVRGLLCHWCNKALGLAGDDPELLRRMAEYVSSDR